MKLHATDAVVIVEIWAGIKNYVSAKDRRSCADQFIATVDEAGLVDFNVASQELYGICETFDKALQNYCQENGFEDEDHNDWDE